MKIIVESGSTKTDWVILKDNKKILSLSTSGFNPNYFPGSVLEAAIKEVKPSLLTGQVKRIHFYGAGCTADSARQLVNDILKKQFPGTIIEVQHDLFGAARALFGNGGGIASILGTGSSSCLFSKHKITSHVPSLGYLLADEGSGAHIGGELIRALFYGDFPEHLKKEFVTTFDIDLHTFIPKLYAREKPNAYVASFVPFAVEHKDNPFIKDLVRGCFRRFFREHIMRYPDFKNQNLGFSGSVAFLFIDDLNDVARECGLRISKVIQGPVEELAKFHMAEE